VGSVGGRSETGAAAASRGLLLSGVALLVACGGRLSDEARPSGRDAAAPVDASVDIPNMTVNDVAEGGLSDVRTITGAGADGGAEAGASGSSSGATMATSYLANPAHTSAIVDPTLVPPLAQLWSFPTVGYEVQYPLIAGGAVYLLLKSNSTSMPNQLVALDEHSGATSWGPLDLSGLYIAGDAYDRGRVFTLTDETDLVEAFDAKTGAVVWTTTFPGADEGGGPPTAYDGVLYLGGSGVVAALDEATGTTLWSASTDIAGGSSPAVTDDGVFEMGACGETYAFERSTGSLLWHYAPGCDGGFSGTAMVFGRQVFLVQGGGEPTVALDALTGHVLPSPSFQNYAAFDGNDAFFTLASGLQSVDRSSGQTTWTFQGDMGPELIPFVAGGTVYVASGTGQMFGVDESTGAQTWSAQADGLGAAGPTVGAEGVLVTVQYGWTGVVGYGHVDLPDASVVLGDGAAPAPVVLASGGGAESLALAGTDVYWTDGTTGEVRKVPKNGGPSSAVYSVANTEPWGITVDSSRVYWTLPNFALGGTTAVMSAPLSGGAPTTLVTNVTGPMSIAVSAANVYWATSGQGAIESVPLDGGPVSTVVSDASGAYALVVEGNDLYWCNADGIYREALAGGTPLQIGPSANAIAVDGTDVYYVDSMGRVARVPVAGGTPTTLATGRTSALVAVAVDGQNVYWLEGEGTIQQGAVAALPKSGGRVAVLASGLGDPSAIAVDDTAIYFTGGGSVEKLVK
jgi:outer membrane protein assembly factor BamB